MNLTYFQPRKTRNEENNNNSPLYITFVAKTSDIRNFSQNIRSHVETSKVATLPRFPLDHRSPDRMSWSWLTEHAYPVRNTIQSSL